MAELMSNVPLARSPALGLSLRARIAYDGPIPRLVVPIGLSPLSPSMKESISFSRGVTTVRALVHEKVGLAALLRDEIKLVLERERVEGDPGADEQLLLLQESRREKVEDERAPADDYGVSRVAPAVVPYYRVEPVSVIIDNLALAFVSPLQADDAEIAHIPRGMLRGDLTLRDTDEANSPDVRATVRPVLRLKAQ